LSDFDSLTQLRKEDWEAFEGLPDMKQETFRELDDCLNTRINLLIARQHTSKADIVTSFRLSADHTPSGRH
jgi:hypothetical protein